jgi:hypothetical protein
LLPAAGAVFEKTPDPHDLIEDLKEFLRKKVMVDEKCKNR